MKTTKIRRKQRIILTMMLFIVSGILISSCKKAAVVKEETSQLKKTESALSLSNGAGFTTNTKNLNIVMFVPTDNPALPDYKTRLSALFTHFQSWFHTEMLRYGYDKYMGLPINDSTNLVKIIEIPAQFGQSAYPYSASVSANKILAEINTYKAAHPTEFSNSSHTLILMPMRTDGGDQPFYGYGKNCFALDNANMAVDKIPNPTSNYLGGMLHELGHGLNLPHDAGKYTSERPTLGTSLMANGNVTFSKGQPTFLTPADAAILNRNEVFQNPLPTEIPYEAATATFDANFVYSSASQSFNVSGSYTSNKEVSDILIYMDPDLGSSDADYNAVTWRFNTAVGNTFTGSIALNDLQYKTNEPYNIRVKLLLKNGNVVSKNYSFSFLNGVPQIGANGSATFYQNGSYGGYAVELPVGNYTTADLIAKGISNNDISSVKLGLGVKSILYNGDNFTGTGYEVTSTTSFLSTFNDQTSSIKVVAVN
ncbi:hypothetical protein [Pedobacter punctiformis]|uniref:Beta/gamma crystallin 'Greek key' domain-containing protein n=1 Tax=Pedobacter punctiformis TaxID=3004097 RepID=A0ABT4LBK1_9SPHI|nr:hypothetical protein [Pedobacter sp. HCMS5-2]MCZ4244184.1 hypothetical protein [Pedobacter sp. HCMS5-2]